MCRNPVKLRTGPRDDNAQHNTQLEKHTAPQRAWARASATSWSSRAGFHRCLNKLVSMFLPGRAFAATARPLQRRKINTHTDSAQMEGRCQLPAPCSARAESFTSLRYDSPLPEHYRPARCSPPLHLLCHRQSDSQAGC